MGRRPKAGSEKAPIQPRSAARTQNKQRTLPTPELRQALERTRAEERQSSREERLEILKGSLHATTLKICENVGEDPGMDVRFSYSVVRALGESAFHYVSSLAKDLEMFAQHAKRVTVNTADVKMCARRSKSLHQRISSLAEQLAEERQASRAAKPTSSTAAASHRHSESEPEDSDLLSRAVEGSPDHGDQRGGDVSDEY